MSSTAKVELDPAIRDAWHVCAVAADIAPGATSMQRLFGRRLEVARDAGGRPVVRGDGRVLPALERYGFIWTSPGTPPRDLFSLPGYDEPDRKNVVTGSVGIRVSAPRAVENFLDMGHFPFVHTGILGEEPHTEVKEYAVAIDPVADEVVATECQFYQPRAAAGSSGGAQTEYVYRVPHPFCAILYKTSPFDAVRMDIVALFVQPVGEEEIIGHTMMSIIDDKSSATDVRHFQLTIFGQDKPILENQRPRKLPLDPRAETPIRADKSSIMYRRWLTSKGVAYGVIPAP